jgi:cell division GTPase FtsZ
MAKKRKTTKRTGRKSASPKVKASSKNRPKAKAKASPPKRKTRKKTTTPKVKAVHKSRPKAKAKASHPKRKTRKKTTTPKVKAVHKSRPKAKAKASHPKRKTRKKTTTPKVKAVHKSRPKAKAKASHPKRKTRKKNVSPKAKVSRRRTRVKAKAKRKAVSRRKVRSRIIAAKPKAVRHRKPRRKPVKHIVSSKRRASKPKATHSRKRHIAKRAKSTRPHVKHSQPRGQKSEFDFNKWLLPQLDLEKYELNIQIEEGVQDNVMGSTRYGWIGSGQCGGRLVKSFYDLGYRKALAVNTTHHDLDLLEIPVNQKFLMDIGEKGAGKSMERGLKAAQEYKSEILHQTSKIFGSQVDHIMVCFGAGGGTGSGSAMELIDIAKRYARYIGLDDADKRVGVLMTLPTVGEASSPLVAKNAHTVATQLGKLAAEGKISPFIIIDNEKVQKMYPGLTVKSFWPSVNQTVAALFDIFNRLSALSSRYTSFDPSDYRSIMEAGGCAIMGLTKVSKFNDKFAISQAVKKNLEKTLLASGFDLGSAKLAGCIVVGSKKLMASVPGLQDNINYAFDVLSEITVNASVHRGIYEDQRDCLRVYTIIGGLDAPASRLEELAKKPSLIVR